MTLSQALQRRLGEVEVQTAIAARAAMPEHGVPPEGDLLVVDGPLRGRQHLPRTLGYIKSHRTTYLPPDLNALIGALSAGQRTPVFLMGTSWDRHSWYLRLPGASGAPWAGVVRIECSADLPIDEVVRLAGLSQAVPGPVCLGRVQGCPRPPEPLPDRRPGTRTQAAPWRPPAAVPGTAPNRTRTANSLSPGQRIAKSSPATHLGAAMQHLKHGQ